MAPIVYLPHGAGPLPLLGDPSQKALAEFLTHLPHTLGNPTAILVISAHWEEKHPTLTGANVPGLIYDYYGFEPRAYTINYEAKGSLALTKRVQECLHVKNIEAHIDTKRGYDHGVFVPLKLMYPETTVPIVQLSLVASFSPLVHIRMGEALRALRDEGVLILGSGLSFHNMRAYGLPTAQGVAFDAWLQETLVSNDYEGTKQKLIAWESAPEARFAHPREEHLLPLHVCFGASTKGAKVVFDALFMGTKVSAFLWE
ncbi:MAG: dioxygenase [Campylobacterales bacterium]|nr:dioxygenase [Campylobacterales bacterium]